ncbi:uncharacterized protein PV07_12085 [Cladophialophora immunda]|uniref:Major facilitator superfamily (MFS) profile domain-containing protein n=1 Tax=Cladophialophora immunda TaxID=569365 RepID=A0A0D2CK46_9EURO|nr:uncharacterized protein PV07_12085 [Cladophialophora immunda]KIW23924.1 hypothetical protein PV07_12085 [Cladophialophora immunda]
MDTLVAANVFLGLSGGVHTCYALTVGEICPNKFKLAGSAFVTIPCILSTGFGAYISSRLAHTGAGWRWCYYSYLMMMSCAAIMQYHFYKPPSFKQLHGGRRTLKEEFRRIDFVGGFLLTAGLVMFLLGISWGGQPIPWTSPRILCLIVIGAVLIVAFVFWEIYSTTPNPLVPMYFFRDLRGFTCLVIICSVSGASYVAPTVVWPSQVAAVYGVRTTNWQENAWLNTTVSFGIIGGIWFWGPMVSVVKHVRIQLLVLATMTCAFNGALASSNRDNKQQSAAFSFLATLPDGIMELMPVALAQMDANDADLGTVFGIVFLFRTVCGSIFTTIYLAILQNKLLFAIAQRVPAAAEAAGLPASSLKDVLTAASVGTAAALDKVPGMNPAIATQIMDALVEARVWSYKFIYLASIPINFCAVVAAFFIKDYDPLLSSHVPRQIYAHGEGVKKSQEKGTIDIEDSSGERDGEKSQTVEIDDAAAAPAHPASDMRETKN